MILSSWLSTRSIITIHSTEYYFLKKIISFYRKQQDYLIKNNEIFFSSKNQSITGDTFLKKNKIKFCRATTKVSPVIPSRKYRYLNFFFFKFNISIFSDDELRKKKHWG